MTPVDGERERRTAVATLRGIAKEIADEGHAGWPNGINWAVAILESDAVRLASLESQISALRALLGDIRDDVVEAFNYSILDGSRNQVKVDRYFSDQLKRIDAAIAIPSAASIGEGGLGDAGREMK